MAARYVGWSAAWAPKSKQNCQWGSEEHYNVLKSYITLAEFKLLNMPSVHLQSSGRFWLHILVLHSP